jgi:EAL domain-containing protein (putative c-di-GMP-specific phosphodiesterase class I)
MGFETSVDAAIANGQIYVDLQPVVELATGRIHGYEALARCTVGSLSSPLQLLAAALAQGALHRLGRELRRQAVLSVKGATLFLNVHPAELDAPDLAEHPITSHDGRLVLEVQETSAGLEALRGRGIAIALDAFGVGSSDFRSMAELAPELVKLDREVIAGVRIHSRRHTLLTSLAALCTSRGAMVVAEGVETHDELLAVMAAGIPLAQGYYLGRPSLTGASTWTPS